ncbi:hypothetical protein VTK73DRAFT_1723 [Phialemonium thermophilum]|uniref:PH domain-containing protein n=1 Tax=Phialemonium thermophilum TaxID=223376 RepID=A0ABR3X8F7_9PEZI
MASTEPVHPLRLSKDKEFTTSSPTKMASAIPRPLSEISPTERRRNSPSWNQGTRKMALNTDSSPFQSSPLDGAASPRLFWQSRGMNAENSPFSNRSGSPSPSRRSSIERLQKASRVKNSNILALEHKQEYDPAKIPHIERPLSKIQAGAFNGAGPRGNLGHQRSESKTNIPLYSPTKTSFPSSNTASSVHPPRLASKDLSSPIKSSLSNTRFKGNFDPETGVWSTDTSCDERELPEGKSLHRHAKSVTFDAAPPQVNEYEMATPDLSSVGSNSREGSYESDEEEEEDDDHYPAHNHHEQDDSFDASLEDTDKTPVFGPEDWRRETKNMFRQSPTPDEAHHSVGPQHNRTDSTNSNGDHRPLPPLPGAGQDFQGQSSSTNGLSNTAERMLGAQRSLPAPPAATSTKSEIQNIGNGKMSLEERLRLMMLSDDGKSAAEQQRERRMRRAGVRERAGSHTPEREAQTAPSEEDLEGDDTIGDLSALDEYQLPPRISRESIMRRVNGNKAFERESDYNFSSPPPSSPERNTTYDPDVPLPSTEDSILENEEDEGGSVIITRNEDDKEVDVYSITDLYQRSESQSSGQDGPEGDFDDDSESHYSDTESTRRLKTAMDEDASSTPRPATPVEEQPHERVTVGVSTEHKSAEATVAKDVKSQLMSAYDPFGLPTADEAARVGDPNGHKMTDVHAYFRREQTPPLSKPEYDGSGWGESGEESEEEPGTPDSVIHHPMPGNEDEVRDSPVIPEQVATIKSSSGSKLKTRPSATPSDIMAMREARRHVSREVPDVPPIPERHRNRLSRDIGDEDLSSPDSDGFLERHPSFKNRSLTLDLDLGLSLDQDFDRVIEAQKRGYLMRQNTKLVAASDKDGDDSRFSRSAGNSPVKQSRPQSWTVEPWNGQVRRRSVKKRPGTSGPVPPLPGQESNAVGLNSLAEEESSLEPAVEDNGERGRLFVKVMGVKDLDLPIPKNERTWFSLTLDNGVHCVTTAWLELARNAPIGQEFELVVPNDLEFQLTLNVKLEKPAQKKMPQSPIKASKPKTVSTFSRVFASPKKRKEMELRQKEEEERFAQQQREAQARQMNAQPSAWDLLSPLAAEDGSFARAYVCLKEHEARCYGRPYLVEVAAFNEWATEEAAFASSVKSKRGNTGVVRRAPYKIGKLELQLLFVPRPKGATEEDMPKSMNSCIREMKAAEERLARNWEGHLSQQGGDCPYWRRRYFKLVGTKLTAYHEATRQPRATINLANAKRLIDDRRTLTEKETTGKSGKRRRSAFAEEEEGYMFVEEGFRIRFNNGEVIDFYADSTKDKEGWMKVLSEVINRDSISSDDDTALASQPKAKGKWCELVLKREESLRRRAEGRRVHSRTKSMYV